MKKKGGFQKGVIVWNKNKKGIHLSPKSEFKKGQRGASWVPIGTVKLVSDHGKPRNKVKSAELKWEFYSAYLWKQKYGKIIKGDIIHHLNGVSTDDFIENIIALPRADHPIFHSRWGLKELTKEQIDYYISRYESSEPR